METKKIKILAIDDNHDNLVVLNAMLLETFPNVTFIQSLSGEKGIELCRSENPDVVLLDIVMPVMDGYEVCRKIKALQHIEHIPVIMITASRGDKDSRIQALECGANAFLSKPIDESELTAQIRAMVLIKESEERKRYEKERLQELVDEQTRELVEELNRRRKAEKELQRSLDNLENSRRAELNLMEDLRVEISERIKKEEALTVSEKKYRNLHESMMDGFASTDMIGNIVDYNESFRLMLGYQADELMNLTYLDLTPEKWHNFERNILSEQVLKRGYSDIYEKEYFKKDGSVFPVELHVFLVKNDLGKPEGIWAIVRDITERKHIEIALKESEERFQLLFDKAPLGYQSLDFDGNFIEVNQQWLNTLGYTREEVIGKWFGDFLSADYKKGFLNRFPIFKAKGQIHSEFEMIHKNGNRLFIAFEGKVGYNFNGEFKQTHCILQDITQTKRTAEALRESEERFRGLYENAPIGIYRTTPDGQILLANPVLVKLFGYKSLKELKHRDLNQEESFEPQYSRKKILEQINRDGKMKGLETTLKRKDGTIVFIRESTVLIRDEFGNPLYYDGTIEDITEQKLAEEAMKESEQRFKTLFNGSPDAIILAEIESGKIIDANIAASKLLLKPISDIKGLHQSRLHPPRIEESAISGFKNHTYNINELSKTVPLETLILRSDGTEVPVEFLANIITLNGKPVAQGVFRDISWRKKAEQELKESEWRFRSLFENMVEGFAFCKMLYENGEPVDFIYLDVNEAFGTLTGLKNAAGRKVSDVIPGIRQADPVLFETYSRVSLSGKPERFEMYIEALKMWFHISVYSPAKEYFVAVFDVINDRKRAEQELKESEEKYRRMVDITPDAVVIHTGRNILFANPASLNLIGAITPEQIVDHSIDEFLHPDYKDIVSNRIVNMYQTGKSEGFTEMKFITLRNEIIDAEVIGIPINYSGKESIQTVVRDITTRKAAENVIRESHEFNSSLLKTLPFGMQIVDEIGNILFIDDKLSQLLGDQVKGKKCWELYKDDHTQCGDCPLRLGINIGETDNYESSGVLGGKVFNISHTGMMYKGNKAMLEIFQDITKRKQEENELIIAKEKAEESDRLKSAFLATMNHELRTPLNHIIGFSSLIQSGVTEDDKMDYAATIETSGKNLLSIIEDIFELSLVEQTYIKVRKQTFSLIDHFMENKASLDEILQSSGKSEQIELIFKPNPSLLQRYITADRSKINQVLANLFKNAIKFTHSGTIEFGYKMQNQGKLMFYVKDTGIGISSEKQSIIFDYFRQVDDSHTRLYGGIGIGLTIALKIAQVLNGELKVESTQGKGSTFRFTIPVGVSEDGKAVKSPVKPKAELDLTGKTILIVEDDLLSAALIKSYLKNSNARILEATEGEKAISQWHLHPEIDLVLMDLKMPGMDGFETTRILKSEKPELPVIALTAYSLPSNKVKAMNAGCDCIVTKPVDKVLLFAEIKKMLS